jgi:hypothetical protein
MKKLTKILAMFLALATTAALSVGLTTAYLTDKDEDVNVMTLGNVSIEQIEQERDENGKLVDFTQAKPAYPAVYEGTSIPYADPAKYPVANNEAWKVVENNPNVIDKFVTVKNTGKSDAFVRTIVAFEIGKNGVNDPYMHLVCNSNADVAFEWTDINIEFDGNYYVIGVFTYAKALTPNETTIPSLKQVYLDKTATNEVCAAYGETFDILVLSQAVQAAGFDSAAQGLDDAFGVVNATNVAAWFGGMNIPVAVANADEARAAMKTPGAQIVLSEDLVIDDDKGTGYCLYAKYDCQIDLNGYDIIVDLPGKDFYGLVYALNGATVDIVGDGDVIIEGGIGNFVWCTGANGATEINIYGGNWVLDSSDFAYGGNNYCEGLYANREGKVNIYGVTLNVKYGKLKP